jgi:putative NADPH-quinone reductase
MRIVVVHAHPSPQSYNAAVFERVIGALRTSGRHEVSAFDLYADGFEPVMSADERRAYETDDPIRDPLVERYAAAVNTAEALVLVYPTWWSGLPAIAKGWFDKVFVPGVAFRFDERTGKVKPHLQHIRRIAGVTTYGSSHFRVFLAADTGRRTLVRTLRLSTGMRTRTTWLGLYSMDASTPAQRAAFLDRVEREFAAW